MRSVEAIRHLRRHYGPFCETLAGKSLVFHGDAVARSFEANGVSASQLPDADGSNARSHIHFFLNHRRQGFGSAAWSVQFMNMVLLDYVWSVPSGGP